MSRYVCFQAEYGIREKLVTGVQTCALPICPEALVVTPRLVVGVFAGEGTAAVDLVSGDTLWRDGPPAKLLAAAEDTLYVLANGERKSGVLGKRVELGGRRIINKKKKSTNMY